MVVTCKTGVADCNIELAHPAGCANYNGLYAEQEGNVVLLVTAAVVAMFMCFTIGANDSANAWGSSVGSGAIGLRHAVLLGGCGEWLGATLLGYGVSDTIKKGVAKLDTPECWACGFCDSGMAVYAVGMLSALLAAACFLLLATCAQMPVSTTHAIVAGVVGMTLVGHHGMDGWGCLEWRELSRIAASWVVSPLLSGAIAVALFFVTNWLAMDTPAPRANALRLMPFLYSLSAWVVTFMIMIKSKPTRNLSPMVQAATSTAVAVFVHLYAVIKVPEVRASLPSTKKAAEEGIKQAKRLSARVVQLETKRASPSVTQLPRSLGRWLSWLSPQRDVSSSGTVNETQTQTQTETEMGQQLYTTGLKSDDPTPEAGEAYDDAVYVFRYLVVFVAFLESFAHGANDTANSTAAFAAVYAAYSVPLEDCGSSETPFWIMSIAGAFVALGVVTLGHRVIKTLGSDIAKLDFHMGFCIEAASTCSVVIATVAGLPVSSTHCQVGAIFFIGIAKRGWGGSDMGLFGKIALTWAATIPFAAALSALILLPARFLITR
mmetsp:Transcript_20021/g.46209  ORF Transcript_20021/g.46209 Transcript_20021/m.46209 type:complete len:547 (-) Transcript_20021:328-1968(-)